MNIQILVSKEEYIKYEKIFLNIVGLSIKSDVESFDCSRRIYISENAYESNQIIKKNILSIENILCLCRIIKHENSEISSSNNLFVGKIV